MKNNKLTQALSHIDPELIEEAALCEAVPGGRLGRILRIGIPAAVYAALLAVVTVGALHFATPIIPDEPDPETDTPPLQQSDPEPSSKLEDLLANMIWGSAGCISPDIEIGEGYNPSEDENTFPEFNLPTEETDSGNTMPPQGTEAIPSQDYNKHESGLNCTNELLSALSANSKNTSVNYAILASGGSGSKYESYSYNGKTASELEKKLAEATDTYHGYQMFEKLSEVLHDPDYPAEDLVYVLQELADLFGSEFSKYYDSNKLTVDTKAVEKAVSAARKVIAELEDELTALKNAFYEEYGKNGEELFSSLGYYVYRDDIKYADTAYAPGPQTLFFATASEFVALAEKLTDAGYSLDDYGFALASENVMAGYDFPVPETEETTISVFPPVPDVETTADTDYPPDTMIPTPDTEISYPEFSYQDILAGTIPADAVYSWNGLYVDYLLYWFMSGKLTDPYFDSPPMPESYTVLVSHEQISASLDSFTWNGYTYEQLIAEIDAHAADLERLVANGEAKESDIRNAKDALEQLDDTLNQFKIAYARADFSAQKGTLLTSLGYTVIECTANGVVIEATEAQLRELADALLPAGEDPSRFMLTLIDYR